MVCQLCYKQSQRLAHARRKLHFHATNTVAEWVEYQEALLFCTVSFASRAPAGALRFSCWKPGTARADRSVTVLATLSSIGPLVPGYSPWPLRGHHCQVLTHTGFDFRLIVLFSPCHFGLLTSLLPTELSPEEAQYSIFRRLHLSGGGRVAMALAGRWRIKNDAKPAWDPCEIRERQVCLSRRDIGELPGTAHGRLRLYSAGRVPSLVISSKILSSPGRDARGDASFVMTPSFPARQTRKDRQDYGV
jgi:hypothetical protein